MCRWCLHGGGYICTRDKRLFLQHNRSASHSSDNKSGVKENPESNLNKGMDCMHNTWANNKVEVCDGWKRHRLLHVVSLSALIFITELPADINRKSLKPQRLNCSCYRHNSSVVATDLTCPSIPCTTWWMILLPPLNVRTCNNVYGQYLLWYWEVLLLVPRPWSVVLIT